MNLYPEKKWRKRDSSDDEWMKLGGTPDSRRNRADAIERDRRRFWMWLIGLVVVLLTSAFLSPLSKERWLPIYYPNPSDLTVYSNGPTVNNIEKCRDWVEEERSERKQKIDEFDYECGLNCDFDSHYGLFVCEKTLQ